MTTEQRLILKKGCFCHLPHFSRSFLVLVKTSLCSFASTLFLALSLIHWVLIGSGQISREKGKKFRVVREKIDKLFEDSRRQHRCFRISDDGVLSEGKEGSKLNHILQVPN